MWITHMVAVTIIAVDLDIPIGEAYRACIEGCQFGVRARYPQVRFSDAFHPPDEWCEIPHDEWREQFGGGYQIRFSNGEMTTYDKIEIDLDSLNLWVACQLERRKAASPRLLKPPSDAMVRDEIRAVYAEEATAGTKPPNKDELAKLVQPRLERRGYEISRNQIRKIAKEPEFEAKRWSRGKRRVTSEAAKAAKPTG